MASAQREMRVSGDGRRKEVDRVVIPSDGVCGAVRSMSVVMW